MYTAIACVLLAVVPPTFDDMIVNDDPGGNIGPGPDALNGALTGIANFATGEINAIATGINLCNVGSENLHVIDNSVHHPISTQNIYRVDGDGITHLGYSWVSHRFCALQQSLCGVCAPPGDGCQPALGIGCSDVKSASFVGAQTLLSSRADVNPVTVDFDPFYPPTTGDPLFKRMQYRAEEAIEALNPGARYFVETITLAKDDAEAGNAENNASHREILLDDFDGSAIVLSGVTERGLGALHAWRAIEPGVRIEHVDIEADGRVSVASHARDNGDGTWTYQYAVMNLNSHESVRSLRVPLSGGAPSGIDFRDIDYHSGDPFVGTDWSVEMDFEAITWSSETIAENDNANAIRWGTTYSFAFTSFNPPVDGDVTLGTFRSGLGVTAGAVVPGAVELCPGDCDGSRTVDFNDLVCILFRFGEIPTDFPVPEDCDNTAIVDFNDLACALFVFGACE